MPEKIIPWWRRAINFALDGLRSRFGLFSRPAKPTLATEPMLSDDFKDDPREEIELAEPTPQFEAVASEPETPIEAGAVSGAEPEPSLEIVGVAEIAPETVPISELGPIQAMEPDEIDLVDSIVIESDTETETEVVIEPEVASLPGIEDEATIEPEQVLKLTIETEFEDENAFNAAPKDEPAAEAEVVVDAAPEPVAEAEPVQEVEPEVDAESGDGQEAEDEAAEEPAEEPAEEAEVVEEVTPEPVAEVEPVPEAEPEAAVVLVPAQATDDAATVAELPQTTDATPGLVAEQTPVAEVAQQLVLPTQPGPDEKDAAKLAARQKKLDESSEESPFSVIVGQVYDGPLDLQLDLIRKQDIDIYDIPIAKITSQFLAYVNQLKASDVDVAGEFIYTASLLIHIKSKMLLPRMAAGPEDAVEDPRRELVERLLEHERFKDAAQMLQQKQMLEAASWTNPGVREFKDDEGTEPEIAADTVDLVRIFRDILERARNRPVINVEEDSVTVGQMIQFLARRLTMEDKPIALRRLLSHTRSERALIAMFLALLEMVRLQAILLRQDRQFSEIFIKKHSGFETVMNEGLSNAQDDWR